MNWLSHLAEGKSKEKSLRIPCLLGNIYILNTVVSRIEFGEVFIIKNMSKGVWTKENLQISSNRSNPTVKSYEMFSDIFEQDSEQNGRKQSS